MYKSKVDIIPLLKERRGRTAKTATANAGRGKGHDKFLRQIVCWIDIEAPRYFWSEMDTYKVGTVAQSESTMHTLSRRDAVESDFSLPLSDRLTEGLNELINTDADEILKLSTEYGRPMTKIQAIKGCLPESYLQRRLVTLNYGVLHTIINQRKGHKLPEWKTFIDSVYEQVEHKELLPPLS